MSREEFDTALLKTYLAAADERPAPAIDERILSAARMQASRRRYGRYLVSLAAAASLALVVGSAQRMHGTSASEAPRVQVASAADRVTTELLRLQPPSTARSTVADFLLNSTPASASDAEANDVP
jgi:hypothetical protein